MRIVTNNWWRKTSTNVEKIPVALIGSIFRDARTWKFKKILSYRMPKLCDQNSCLGKQKKYYSRIQMVGSWISVSAGNSTGKVLVGTLHYTVPSRDYRGDPGIAASITISDAIEHRTMGGTWNKWVNLTFHGRGVMGNSNWVNGSVCEGGSSNLENVSTPAPRLRVVDSRAPCHLPGPDSATQPGKHYKFYRHSLPRTFCLWFVL
jgi:hypothetical protein